MNTKTAIRKIVIISLWVVTAGGMLLLLIAAMGKQSKDVCAGYEISIKGVKGNDLFVDEKDIVKLVKAATDGAIKGQKKGDFDLQQIEDLLEGNPWIKEARLYFDNKNMLQVSVTERSPIARVFTTNGRSFYIDESQQQMQLSDKLSTRLPVFTGFPEKKTLSKADSALLKGVQETATFINANPFWSAQVAQLDIVRDGKDYWEMEMIPLVGNHIIKLGDSKNIDKKFDRLFTFYKTALSKIGFGQYRTIDVRYEGQVVAAKSENPKVDNAELKKSVDRMLQQVKEAEKNSEKHAAMTTAKPEVMKAVELSSLPEETIGEPEKDEEPKEEVKTKPVVENKKKAPAKTEKKETAKKEPEKRTPKAVMTKKNN